MARIYAGSCTGVVNAAVDAIVVATPQDVERYKDSHRAGHTSLRCGRGWVMYESQPERFPPDDPREWLNRARSNLALGKEPQFPSAYLEDLCFEAQQAAEKSIKAVMIKRDVEFPYVHDLGRLLTMLEIVVDPIPEEVREAVVLTKYAWESRYPGVMEPVSDRDYANAIRIAEAVVQWAEESL